MTVTEARQRALTALRTQTFDVLIVGGGIVGTSIARDLALRGARVALIEQHDLASGTSSRPTRLVHGGLRYLENYDFGLVREDLREREILLRTAPHLVYPLPFLLPQYGREAGDMLYRAKLRAGMVLYDLLSFDKSLPGRRWLSRDEVRREEPGLKSEGLQGAWRYFDAQVPLAERLVVENALDAAAHGGVVVTHARVERFLRDENGAVTGVLLRDLLSGQESEARAQLTINASGPWLDVTDKEIRPSKPPLLRLTKGVHLVTPSATRHAHALFAQSDGRLFFVVPWLGYSLVGTTDTDYKGDPHDASADEADVRYLSAEAQSAFPDAPLDTVHYAYAGVRALVRVEGVSEGEVSRKHKVLDHAVKDRVAGIVSVVGGKLTAARGIAEEVGNLVAQKIGLRVGSETSRLALPGGAIGGAVGAAARDLARFVETAVRPRVEALGLAPDLAEHLARVYGALAHEVLDLVERDRSLGEPLAPGETVIAAEIVRATEREWAVTLADFLLRRTTLGLRAGQAVSHLNRIAETMGRLRGWDAARVEEEVNRYLEEIAPMRRFSAAPIG